MKLRLCFQKCKEMALVESRKMCIYSIFKDDLGFYCFQIRETIRSKEDTSNSKRLTT
jgi:hypothetical protein